jgi:benzil reductase ((S)-benzoin forming)
MNLIYITGTSKGIGEALANELLKNAGNKVIGIARNQTIKHNNYIHFNIDLSDIAQIKSFKFKVPPGIKKVVLVNNAGSLGEINHFGNLSADMISDTLNINLAAPMILMNDFLKAYQDAVISKVVVNITSGAANSPYDGWGMYCTAKAGMDMMTQVADQEQQLKKYPAKILGVAPGVVDTNMQTQIRKTKTEHFSRKQKFVELKEQNQLYRSSDVAKRLAAIIFNPDEETGGLLISRITV